MSVSIDRIDRGSLNNNIVQYCDVVDPVRQFAITLAYS